MRRTRSPRAMVVALAVSVALTLTIGITAYATRADHAPARGSARGPFAPVTRGPDYVAIGDSFTAGGPIGAIQSGSDACRRSEDDYPNLVARRTHLSLTDVSCTGASTADALVGANGGPAQLDAVTDKAKLVTISMGGNDYGIFVNVFLNCIRFAKASLPGSPCRNKVGAWVASRLPSVQRALSEVVASVQARAPEARIMVVNYLRILPDAARCEAIPYTPGDVAWVSSVEHGLAEAMRGAATSRGVPVVDMYEKSRGHDVCSDQPWTNGLRPKLNDGLFLHPNADGQRAIARAVTAAWRQESNAPH